MLNRLSNACLLLASIALICMTIILSWQVFSRYVLGASPSWSEQASLVLMIWTVFPAAAAGVHEGFHIRIVEGVKILPDRLRRAVYWTADGLVALFGLGMCVLGGELVLRTWPNAIPTLPISRGMMFLVIPLAGLMIFSFALARLRDTDTRNQESSWS